MAEIVDTTPLAGARIDIPARIGWLLRTSRTSRGVTLRALSSALPFRERYSTATLSRIETAGIRNSAVIAAYEEALDLPYGYLRSSVDVLCRTFTYAPRDQGRFVPEQTLAAFSNACRSVSTAPTGHDWLTFAEHHTAGAFGLPDYSIQPHVRRLASELGRSNGTGYRLRYEALAKLRCSPYQDVVFAVIEEAVSRPGAQRLNDLMSAVSENPTPKLLRWAGDLLSHESAAVAHAACLAIQNMRSVGGLAEEDWHALAPPYAAACDQATEDPRRGPILASTLATCEKHFRDDVQRRLRRPLPPVRRPRWEPDGDHYAFAASIAKQAVGDSQGLPLLTRLVFELLYDFRLTHVVTSAFLLGASVFADRLQPLLQKAALHGPDHVTRHGAAYAFANLMLPLKPVDSTPWLAAHDPVIRRSGLIIAAHSRTLLPSSVLRRMVDDPATSAEAVFAAGMTAHPDLTALASNDTLRHDVRAAAQWWLDEGSAVLDQDRGWPA